MTNPLQLTGLSKAYGEHVVLRDVDLVVAPGETVALVGPNGAGKSTLLGCVCGTVIADAGTVTIGGHDLHVAPIEARRRLRYLAQESDVPAGVTGREILELLAEIHGDPGSLARASDIAALGPALEHLATTYSVGMRRRLLFAGMLPGRAELYVLDEPFAGVDAEGRQRMLDVLRANAERGAGLLIAAHDPDEAPLSSLGARVVALDAQS